MTFDALGYVVAAVLAVCGTAFLAIAGYFGLLGVVEPPLAALLTGTALLVIAFGVARYAGLRARRQAQNSKTEDPIEEALRAHLDTLMAAGVRRHPAGAAIGSLLLGLVAGRSGGSERRTDSRGRSDAR